MRIYIDENYRCHKQESPGHRAFDIPAFDGKIEFYIKGFVYVPDGESMMLPGGETVTGPYLTAVEPIDVLAGRQHAAELEALELLGAKGELEPAVYAAATRRAVNGILPDLSDADALAFTALIDAWQSDMDYAAGMCVAYGQQYYRCLTSHTAQPGWTPDTAPSLWVRIDDPAVEWPTWRQPMGAHDAYRVGDKVTYEDKRWVCIADYNVWPPGVQGWQEVTVE